MTTLTWLTASLHARWARHRSAFADAASDAGEGVISAAIVVLIMALLGAGMWVAFNQIWTTTETKTDQNVSTIGS
jgi:hypothetical protein